jgi:Spy/CpxP family protein refolding chaperone
MQRKYINKTVLILAAIITIGGGGYAYADWGPGYGHHRWMHSGPGYRDWGNLSEEQLQKLDDEREAFFKETEDLRIQLYQKSLELKSELANKNPDANKASEIQKALSNLNAQFAEKRLEHILKMKTAFPEAGMGYLGSYGMMGPGMMGYHMKSPWGSGREYDPPCFYEGPGESYGRGYGQRPGMMGRGYGRGPDMMGPGYGIGPGMMGPRWGRQMGPGWSGRDYPRQYSQSKGPIEEKDAGAIVEDYIRSSRNPNLKLGKIEDTGEAFKVEVVTKDNSIVDEVLVDKSSGRMRSAY